MLSIYEWFCHTSAKKKERHRQWHSESETLDVIEFRNAMPVNINFKLIITLSKPNIHTLGAAGWHCPVPWFLG
ncbi:MAG: hypothetical protein IPP77_06840 [Bacteroidetes bacterium]|nr:hypothetical protein [Bacteroidota bacterium]